MTPQSQLDSLRELLAKATPGPWRHVPQTPGFIGSPHIQAGDEKRPTFIAEGGVDGEELSHNEENDIALIVALRNGADELLDENERLRGAVEGIDKFVRSYFEPWGSWKTAWWEDEVSDDAAFSDNNALKHVANLASAALHPKQERDDAAG